MRRGIVILFFLLVVSFVGVAEERDSSGRTSLLFFGDINLGRTVGQWLLQGKTDYPFAAVRSLCQSADIVFANLESIISEQNGETVSPLSNVVFCAPPVAASVLRDAHVMVVSLANNHAFDYGEKGLRDSKIFLDSAKVLWTGIVDDDSTFHPVIVERNGMRIGFVAYTQILNFQKGKPFVSMFDTVRARKEIGILRSNVDMVVASYHGGQEYIDSEDSSALRHMQLLADYGASFVIGHHPHVPLGIHRYRNSILVSSLGNFVFYQPQKYWTRYGLGVECIVEKTNTGCVVKEINVLPFRAGYQPTMVMTQRENNALYDRLKELSTVTLNKTERGYSVELSENDE